MKRLTLLRHAKSSWDNVSLDDFERPLNPRGRRAAPEMGRRLLTGDSVPDLIISSPARRAISTARMVAREINYAEARIIEDRSLYHAGWGQILAIANSLETLADHLMVCGHNPGLTDLANMLGNTRIDNMPTASVFCVDFEILDWSELEAGSGQFAYFDMPKNDRGWPFTSEEV
jgi:phosphohistidine phosphatase